MNLHFIFLLLAGFCSFSTLGQKQSLQVELAGNIACSYDGMTASFNATGMNSKIDGTATQGYILFAVCDGAGERTFTAADLNYHLAHGIIDYASLPDDALLDTDDGTNKIRMTRYSGVPFANGKARLSNKNQEDYYSPADTTNAVFYKIAEPLVRPSTKTILEALASNDYPEATNIAAILSQITFVPPATSWTLLLPVDTAFNGIPPYQKDYLVGGATNEAITLLNHHAISGTHFAAPLQTISKEKASAEVFDYYFTASGRNMTMSYYQQTYVLDKKFAILFPKLDGHYADGVIHTISDFFYYDEIGLTLPAPTLPEFFEQYSVFQTYLKNKLGFVETVPETKVAQFISFVKDSGVVIPDVEVTMFFMQDKALAYIGVTSLSTNTILYHIIQNQYDVDALPLDKPIPTYAPSDKPNYLRINNYNGVYYINGMAKIIIPNIKLNKATIHIIDTTELLAPACAVGDLECISADEWFDTTVVESITADPEYSYFAGFLAKTTIQFTDPFTIVAISDDAYNVKSPELVDYLNSDVTALDAYLSKLYSTSTIYPNAAHDQDITFTTADGSSYTVSKFSATSLQFNDAVASARIRKDGIYYAASDFLFDTSVPAAPVAPGPAPVQPTPDPIKPVDSYALRLNGIQIWFCLFSVLAVLFFM